MENKPEKDPEVQPKSFQPKVLFIWLAILALIIGLVVSQSNTPVPTADSPGSVDDLLTYAKDGRIAKAVIQSDPKGGDEWYVIQGNFLNSGFDPESHESNNHKALPFVVKGRVTESEYKELREALGKNLEESPSSTIWTDLLFSLLPFLLIIGLLYFLFVRQLRMAGKGALNFGKSKAKMLTRENEKILFNDVAGCDEAKELSVAPPPVVPKRTIASQSSIFIQIASCVDFQHRIGIYWLRAASRPSMRTSARVGGVSKPVRRDRSCVTAASSRLG